MNFKQCFKNIFFVTALCAAVAPAHGMWDGAKKLVKNNPLAAAGIAMTPLALWGSYKLWSYYANQSKIETLTKEEDTGQKPSSEELKTKVAQEEIDYNDLFKALIAQGYYKDAIALVIDKCDYINLDDFFDIYSYRAKGIAFIQKNNISKEASLIHQKSMNANGVHETLRYIQECADVYNSRQRGNPTTRTALMWLALEGEKDCIRVLLEHGANNLLVDVNGKTAYKLGSIDILEPKDQISEENDYIKLIKKVLNCTYIDIEDSENEIDALFYSGNIKDMLMYRYIKAIRLWVPLAIYHNQLNRFDYFLNQHSCKEFKYDVKDLIHQEKYKLAYIWNLYARKRIQKLHDMQFNFS